MTAPVQRTQDRTIGSVLRSGLFRSGLGTAGIRITGLGLTFLLSVFLARVMGAEGLGHYTLAFAIISLLGLPVQMGLPALVLRETAKANATQDWPLMQGLWVWAVRRTLVISGFIVLVALVAVLSIPEVLHDEFRAALLIGLPLVPLIALSAARAGALQGLGKAPAAMLPEMLLRPGMLMLVGAGFYIVAGQAIRPDVMMGVHLLASALAFAAGSALLLRFRPAALAGLDSRRNLTRDWRRAIWPLALIAGSQSIIANADFLMLGWWRDAQQVGLYKVATAGAMMTSVGLGIVAMVMNPRFAALHRTGEMSELSRQVAVSAAAGFGLALPVVLAFGLWGEPILAIAYGEPFRPAYPLLLILTAAQAANAFFGPCTGLLNMTGYERLAMHGSVVAMVANVALNALLIPALGAIGAAVATLASTLLGNVLMWWQARRRLGADSSALAILWVRS
ncbi:flippase [Thalassobius vesicularis]|uniref:Flippase n=1 Tax=Thalassobius vesicularis TaxID=1294297 RepID=A0A4S3MDJ5_9RHOB|nr:flippase [Thalassobius vesicularis]THD76760.1 flippase [Thalassobius vesicularis]